jgi:uncharacterized protein DUF6056
VRVLLPITLAASALPLLSFAIVGWFSRYAADDYCTASQVVMAGLIQAQSRLYVNWSGRFSATLFNTLLEVVGVRAVPLLPALALVAWLAATAWAVHQLVAPFGWRLSRLASAALGALLIWATLDTTADLPQVMFWQTGLVTYLLPLILASLFVGWVARPRMGWIGPTVAFVLAFVAGGTSETFAAAQLTALTCAVAVALVARGRGPAVLLAGLVGAVLALVVVALAPGNEVRQEPTARTPLLIALPEALEFTLGWLRLTFARPHALALALLFALPALVAALTPRSSPSRSTGRALPMSMVLGGALTVFACILPAFYALNTNPPGRAQLIPEFVVMSFVGMFGWCVGARATLEIRQAVQRREVAVAGLLTALVLLALGPVLSARRTLVDLGAARAYAAQWDRLDGEIRADQASGLQSVSVPPLPSTGSVQNLDWVGPDPKDWFNQCVAGYYGVSSIAANRDG